MIELIRSIPVDQDLISVHREVVEPDTCYVGRIVDFDQETLSLFTIDPGANWVAEPMRIRLEDITRIDFGGAYEDALSLVAGARESH